MRVNRLVDGSQGLKAVTQETSDTPSANSVGASVVDLPIERICARTDERGLLAG